MATVLLTWELGGGLGHLINLLPLAKGLRQRGHRVFAAVQDLSRAEKVFGGLGVSCLQAPVRLDRLAWISDPASASTDSLPNETPERAGGGDVRPISGAGPAARGPRTIALPRTMAHILYNCGFGGLADLRTLAGAWRNLYELIRPNLIVFDHSPTAMLAASGTKVKRAMVGTGFFCPLDQYPMADLRLGPAQDPMLIKQDEDLVLAHANQVLADWGREPLGRLSLLYHQVDETFLATFAELDHYGGRPAARYWGAWPNVGGKKPLWPQGRGQRVFAYVKPFRALARLLQQLCDLQYPTLVYAPGMASDLAQRFGAATMRFEAEPLDLGETGRSCDLAILNGNHGTTVAMLLAGKPTLQVPIALEQGLFSMAVARLGAAVVVPPDRPQEAVAGLMRLLGSEAPAEAARAFAARYADYDPQRQVEAILGRIEELLQ